jgi:hypothetical protein
MTPCPPKKGDLVKQSVHENVKCDRITFQTALTYLSCKANVRDISPVFNNPTGERIVIGETGFICGRRPPSRGNIFYCEHLDFNSFIP